MSNTYDVLNALKPLIEAKNSKHNVMSPTYSKEGDIHSTLHIHSLTSMLASGKVFTISIHTHYIPFKGADYELCLTVAEGNVTHTHLRFPIQRAEISVEGIKKILKEKVNMTL